ncbi:MAG: ABC transporter ATP-binding protein [Gammaproteobacteria bacterium]|nr:ABC transporter ATP-binding protein [Gammaproteobacteria bacterium]MDH5512802.1 ABC transporter ATP-binding protein [Gammaproteobacteria bacterium]
MSSSVVSVTRVSKHFDSVTAVEDVSFDVRPQSTTALLGGNGAGKTTTLSMLLGLLLPTSGSISVFGVDMLRDRYRVLPRLNFSSPYVDLPRRLTVRENLTVYARLYGVIDIPGRLKALSEELQIGSFMKRPYGQLSAGEKTRVALAKALLNEPELMLFDEPTASLDPDTADYVRGMLEAYRKRTGTTILLASHNMSEVERLCDDVIMLRAGRVVDRGTPAQLLTRYGRRNMEEVFIDIARERKLEMRLGEQQVVKK